VQEITRKTIFLAFVDTIFSLSDPFKPPAGVVIIIIIIIIRLLLLLLT
jgi:membrane protein insertase Oxa1/YidC/SpoIIIJ